jgi:hypothetical protein
MGYKYLLPLLGLLLIVAGTVERGWAWLAVWLGCNLVALLTLMAKAYIDYSASGPTARCRYGPGLSFFQCSATP